MQAISNHSVERVLRSGCPGLARGRGDIALRGRHRFVTQQFHQRVHADFAVRQFGYVGVAQAVYECSAYRLGAWSGTPEGAPHARLYGAPGDSLSVVPDEQGRAAWPA